MRNRYCDADSTAAPYAVDSDKAAPAAVNGDEAAAPAAVETPKAEAKAAPKKKAGLFASCCGSAGDNFDDK